MLGERCVPRTVLDNATTVGEDALVEHCAMHNLTQQAVLLHMQSHQPLAADRHCTFNEPRCRAVPSALRIAVAEAQQEP